MKKKVKQSLAKFAVGAAVSAVLAAGAATYFFTQTASGKKAAKKIQAAAANLSKEITSRLEHLKKVTQSQYNNIVDQVVDEYAAQRKVGKQTVHALKRDLKNHWRQVNKELAKR